MADAGEGAKYVFPNPEGDGSLPAAAVARTILRAHEADKEHPSGRFGIAHFTAHDLRRTAVSKMAELGVAPIVLGHIINHRSITKAGVTLSTYQQYDYAKEKRQASYSGPSSFKRSSRAAPQRRHPSRGGGRDDGRARLNPNAGQGDADAADLRKIARRTNQAGHIAR